MKFTILTCHIIIAVNQSNQLVIWQGLPGFSPVAQQENPGKMILTIS